MDIPVTHHTDSTKSWAMAGPCLAIILAALGTSGAAVTLPSLAEAFAAGHPDPDLVVSLYILATTALIVPVGRAGDAWGRKAVLLAGLSAFAAGAALAIFAPNLTVLIAARVVQGTGAAAMMAMPMALVRDVIPSEKTGRWMGLLGAMSAIGTAAGPSAGGVLTDAFGWQAVFVVQALLALLAFLLSLGVLRDQGPTQARTGFDGVGAIALAVALAAFVLGIGADSRLAMVLWASVAVIASTAFVRIETRVPAPMVDLCALRSDPLSSTMAINFLVSAIMIGILLTAPFFLTRGLGLSTAQMGLAMSVGPVSAALNGWPAGRITEWLGPARGLVWGCLLVLGGATAMVFLPGQLGLPGFWIAFICLAPGYQQLLVAANTSVMASVEAADRGVASGLLNLSRNFGFVIGASVMGSTFARFAGGGPLADLAPQDAQRAMTASFTLATGLAAVALLLAMRLARRTPGRRST